MSYDDLLYFVLLLLAVFASHFIKRTSRKLKACFSFLIGVLMFLGVAGLAMWHSLVTVMGFIFLLNLCPQKFIHYVTIIWCFMYLGFFRSCHHFGFSATPSFANAVQMNITLRLIGLAFELYDSWESENSLLLADNSDKQVSENMSLFLKYKVIKPSPLEIIMYCYCYVGLFTGPYYKFRTFQDFVDWPESAPPASNDQFIERLQEGWIFGVMFFISSYFYSVDYVRKSEFFEHSFAYRFVYMGIVFCIFRFRMYCGWKMSESVCIYSGMGGYPASSLPECGSGPTDLKALDLWFNQLPTSEVTNSLNRGQSNYTPLANETSTSSRYDQPLVEKYDYNTVSTLSVWGCEFAPTVRDGIRSWNKTVQYWLSHNIYKRLKGPQVLRVLVTMLISAYWHGLHLGYYLCLCMVPLAFMAEKSLANLVAACGRGLPDGSAAFFSWLLKMRIFEYLSVGFLLLDAPTTLAYWHSIGYCIHLVIFSLILLDWLLRCVLPRRISAH